MATEDWIQESLARLESLEEERGRHEAALETADDAAALRMHAQAVERLDAKIRSLYAELEAAAEQGDGADASADDHGDVDADDGSDDEDDAEQSQPGQVEVETRLFRREDVAAQAGAALTATPAQAAPVSSSPAASPFGGAAASAPMASPFGGSAASTPEASPFGAAASAPEASPFGGSAASAPASTSFSASSGGGFAAAPASSFSGSGGSLDDDESRRSGAPWGLIIALILVVGGVGGYFALRPKEAPPPEVPAGPTKVIKAGGVPDDTQGPRVVKGANVDSVTGTQFKEGRPQPSGGGGGGGSSTATPTDKPKKKDPRTKIESTDDPLAGIDK